MVAVVAAAVVTLECCLLRLTRGVAGKGGWKGEQAMLNFRTEMRTIGSTRRTCKQTLRCLTVPYSSSSSICI